MVPAPLLADVHKNTIDWPAEEESAARKELLHRKHSELKEQLHSINQGFERLRKVSHQGYDSASGKHSIPLRGSPGTGERGGGDLPLSWREGQRGESLPGDSQKSPGGPAAALRLEGAAAVWRLREGPQGAGLGRGAPAGLSILGRTSDWPGKARRSQPFFQAGSNRRCLVPLGLGAFSLPLPK